MREKYIVVHAETPEELERKVIQLIEVGYITVGGVCVTPTTWAQAMETL